MISHNFILKCRASGFAIRWRKITSGLQIRWSVNPLER